ncbi:DEAH-box nuclear pre-mRNA splicing factor [Volvox carteri f. nagariensis]|uniref:RNA helicase n=1 Tax=Volvox carteri f. nagariensis TaxID=3068 RepID=D8UHF7_VOLCA|nr:DEAH-box nuclear pre-mRNA splicing factor [Volvox carteri f. nagariensis]EFJ40817.1 DEAH-box nuclear pre-mRNA splicing factor [Volvox carteri f. nagariensis]|eukprot:XP_002958086.1 DEAH-box nuclear pre-mRNA splicing factor [Volvox carteri f. nagariensis]
MSNTGSLPIRIFSKDILAAVKNNDVIVVIGETGSGKTTQLSQILYEAGYASDGMIAVTQPRRVGAVTVAKRVAEERGVQLGREVGYAVRFEDCSSSATRIKYLTDGTLLRECLEDPQLKRYSIIVLDEAHERSLNTDILFGLLKRLVRSRNTQRAKEGETEAGSSSSRARRLKLVITSATLDGEKFSAYFGNCPVFNVPGRCFPVDIIHTLEDHLSDYVSAAIDTVMQIHTSQPDGDILMFLTGQAEIEKAIGRIHQAVASLPAGSAGPLVVLPLYASLPPELQVRVFRPAPEGTRRCIVATNVAETSITVEGVVYVVDPGVVKQKSYQPASGMDSLDVVAISRVQATQRAGRAGRTKPGKCFRLYTRTYYEHKMPNVTAPEIQRSSLVGTVLYLKSLQLEVDVLNFDFLDPPAVGALEDALRQLLVLDALDSDGNVTPLGLRMSGLPLEPALARALLAARELGCVREMISVAAMLSSEHVFLAGQGPGDVAAGDHPHGQDSRRYVGLGDHVLLLRLWEGWEAAGCSREFAREYGLDLRGLNFARDIRRQLDGRQQRPSSPQCRWGGGTAPGAARASAAQVDALRHVLTIGFANKLARRLPRHNGYKTLHAVSGQLAQLHPSCAQLREDADGLLPEFLVYHELVATSRPFLRQVCPSRAEWVADVLPKIMSADVRRLSQGSSRGLGGAAGSGQPRSPGGGDGGGGGDRGGAGGPQEGPEARRNDDKAVDAARARYLARKQQQPPQPVGKSGHKR